MCVLQVSEPVLCSTCSSFAAGHLQDCIVLSLAHSYCQQACRRPAGRSCMPRRQLLPDWHNCNITRHPCGLVPHQQRLFSCISTCPKGRQTMSKGGQMQPPASTTGGRATWQKRFTHQTPTARMHRDGCWRWHTKTRYIRAAAVATLAGLPSTSMHIGHMSRGLAPVSHNKTHDGVRRRVARE